MKKCSKCGVEKELSEFRKDKTKSDGLYSSCKLCISISSKDYLEAKSAAKRADKEAHKQILISSPTKYCGKCKKEKPKSEFHKSHGKGDGLVSKCKECQKVVNHNHYLDNKEWYDEQHKIRSQKPESRERRRILGKTRHKANKNFHSAVRRTQLTRATPKWLTDEQKLEIKSFYKTAHHMSVFHEEKFEVDHIEPLIGKTSCGLMVPWNLRVIPAYENRSKGNKLITQN